MNPQELNESKRTTFKEAPRTFRQRENERYQTLEETCRKRIIPLRHLLCTSQGNSPIASEGIQAQCDQCEHGKKPRNPPNQVEEAWKAAIRHEVDLIQSQGIFQGGSKVEQQLLTGHAITFKRISSEQGFQKKKILRLAERHRLEENLAKRESFYFPKGK